MRSCASAPKVFFSSSPVKRRISIAIANALKSRNVFSPIRSIVVHHIAELHKPQQFFAITPLRFKDNICKESAPEIRAKALHRGHLLVWESDYEKQRPLRTGDGLGGSRSRRSDQALPSQEAPPRRKKTFRPRPLSIQTTAWITSLKKKGSTALVRI
jgi:hypothetical protein